MLEKYTTKDLYRWAKSTQKEINEKVAFKQILVQEIVKRKKLKREQVTEQQKNTQQLLNTTYLS